ncbi:MAG: heme-binding protein [Xanthomonadales bacterium]|nr:heme-binding protein [Xanthomonadales bacterium]
MFQKTGWMIAATALTLAACNGGSRSDPPGATTPPDSAGSAGCDGFCTTAESRLSTSQVRQIIAQAAAEAAAQGVAATIAVTDRVGNVLAVYRMNGAPEAVTITSKRGINAGLDGIDIIPSQLAAIAKAVTGGYLTSEGNAFTTRTAGQIVQEHFNPGEIGQPSGPLFGVQFSQLPCSDFAQRAGEPGPQRSPLGLSADPGGMPLYLEGAPVGGIGVEADGLYTFDPVLTDFDRDIDELIAVAGTHGFGAPADRRANRITVEGKVFRFADVDAKDLAQDPANAPSFDSINGSSGALLPVRGYFDGTIRAGVAFGTPASGIRADDTDYSGLDAFVLVDENNQNRFAPRAGTDGENALTEDEVRTLLQEALKIANRARAQIRRPVGSQARVSISVVDSNGAILGIARTRDAPVFGLDVSLQKARTASFFSNANAGADLRSAADVTYVTGEVIRIGDYAQAAKDFLGSQTALEDGAFAFADRSGGNLSRPFFPDGIVGTENGPFSKPFEQWSPFNVGLQLDLVFNRVVGHVLFAAGLADTDAPRNCTGLARLGNGIQIFPGSVPIYRGSTLVGGIGVSGDGIDQDDMISFLGLHNAGQILGTINNAPPEMRADNLTPKGTRLRYVQCPQSPFLDSNEQDVCQGK